MKAYHHPTPDEYRAEARHDGHGHDKSEGLEHIAATRHRGQTVLAANGLDNQCRGIMPIPSSIKDHDNFGGGETFDDVAVLERDLAASRAQEHSPTGPHRVREEVGGPGVARRAAPGFGSEGPPRHRGFIVAQPVGED
jgi:hypothetical protein